MQHHVPHGMGSRGPLCSLKRAYDKGVCCALCCIFINCFLARNPGTVELSGTSGTYLSQGMSRLQWTHCIVRACMGSERMVRGL